MTVFLVVLSLLVLSAILFLMLPASDLSRLIRVWLPRLLIGLGSVLIVLRQAGLGTLFLLAGLGLLHLNRRTNGILGQRQGTGYSHVRSAALEMELDHNSGEMNGLILVGQFEGQALNDLNETELLSLRTEISNDGESLALLDAYLDRRFSKWRENTQADTGAGQAGPPSTGAMSKEEAYEVLGLPQGAGVVDIRDAHRRLMKAVHPDSGGSTFLATKINEAKDVLLRSHA